MTRVKGGLDWIRSTESFVLFLSTLHYRLFLVDLWDWGFIAKELRLFVPKSMGNHACGLSWVKIWSQARSEDEMCGAVGNHILLLRGQST